MIDTAELVRVTRAALRLVLGDSGAQNAFDVSLDGFWRSFAVIGLLAPTALVSIVADHELALAAAVDPSTVSAFARLVAGSLSYVLGWIAFPVAAALLARPFALDRVYVPWMVARNWTSIIAAIPAFVVTLAWLLGLLPTGLLGPGSLASLGFSLYCLYVVARRVAGLGIGSAAAFVLLDLLLSMVIEVGLDRLFGL